MRRERGYKSDRQKEEGLPVEVLTIRVHTKVTKGGRNLSFAALVAVGDGKGKLGIGYGKARGVPVAIEKGTKDAKRSMSNIPLYGDTVPHEQIGRYKASRIVIRPAAPGTGVKAGQTVSAIMSVLGVRNVLTKSVGNTNPLNLAKAAFNALVSMRSVPEVERLRGTQIRLMHPQWAAVHAAARPSQTAAPAQSARPAEGGA